MHIVFVVFFFITAIVLGPLFIIFGYLHLRRRNINKRELEQLHREISVIRSDLDDIKEQLADFIIKTH